MIHINLELNPDTEYKLRWLMKEKYDGNFEQFFTIFVEQQIAKLTSEEEEHLDKLRENTLEVEADEEEIEESEEYKELASYSERIQAQLSVERFSALQKYFDAKMEAKRKSREL